MVPFRLHSVSKHGATECEGVCDDGLGRWTETERGGEKSLLCGVTEMEEAIEKQSRDWKLPVCGHKTNLRKGERQEVEEDR